MYRAVYKGGRCFKSTHRDRGIVVHLIEGDKPNGFWGGKSLCGAVPGRRSYGWVLKETGEPTCALCFAAAFKENMIQQKVTETLKYLDFFAGLKTSGIEITAENSHLVLGTVRHSEESKRRGQAAYWSPFAQRITDCEYNRLTDKLPPLEIKVWELCQPDNELAAKVYDRVIAILDTQNPDV